MSAAVCTLSGTLPGEETALCLLLYGRSLGHCRVALTKLVDRKAMLPSVTEVRVAKCAPVHRDGAELT